MIDYNLSFFQVYINKNVEFKKLTEHVLNR